MASDLISIRYLNLDGLLNAGVSDFLMLNNECSAMKNCWVTKIGKLEKVPGYSDCTSPIASLSLSVSPSVSPSISPSVSPSISPSPSAIASSAIIKVWGYIGTKSAGTSYPYSSSVDADIAADTNNWIQLGEHSISAGAATFTATEFQIDADAASTTYNAHFSVDICWPKIRFSAYSSISFQQQGTLKVVALVQ